MINVKKEIDYLIQLLSEIDMKPTNSIGIRPGSTLGRTAQNSTRREYQLCRQDSREAKILHVTLDQFTTDDSLHQEVKSKLEEAISEFWASGNADHDGKVDIEY